MNDNLQQLRDIHLPDSVSIFPLAPGWYMVFLITITVGGAVWFYCRYKQAQKKRYYLAALHALEAIRQQTTGCKKSEILAELSMLLRRTALAIYPRKNVAGLQGEAWLQFLDETSNTTDFTEGLGHIFLTGPYQRRSGVKLETVFALTELWIKQACK